MTVPPSSDIVALTGFTTPKSLGGNAVWFSSDVTPTVPTTTRCGKFRITFNIDTTAVVQITRNAQVLWDNLNSGNTFQANSEIVLDIMVHSGDKVNLRSTSAVTVNYCYIDEFGV